MQLLLGHLEIRELRTTTDKKMQAHSEMMESLVRRNMSLEKRVGEVEDLLRNLEMLEKLERE